MLDWRIQLAPSGSASIARVYKGDSAPISIVNQTLLHSQSCSLAQFNPMGVYGQDNIETAGLRS